MSALPVAREVPASVHWSALPLTGKVLLEASAGTGKTWQIALLYLRLLLEAGADSSQILVCTFTDAAAAELRARIRQRLAQAAAWLDAATPAAWDEGDELARWLQQHAADPALRLLWRQRLKLARLGFDHAPVGTIHGFCKRVLGELPFASGGSFRSAELIDEQRAWDEVYADFRRSVLHAPRAGRPDWASVLLQPQALGSALGELRNNPQAPRLRPPPLAAALPDDPRQAFAPAHWRALQDLPRALVGGRKFSNKLKLLLSGAALSAAQWAELNQANLRDALTRPLGTIWQPTLAALFEVAGRAGEPAIARPQGAALAAADQWCASTLANRLRAAGQLGFNQLISQVHAAVCGTGDGSVSLLAATLGRAHPHLLIDEFQDTDQRQYQIFAALHAAALLADPVADPVADPARERPASLHLVGDPKQAIYGFRGGDIAAYSRAARQPGLERYSLTVNQRSSAALVAALNALYGAAPGGGFADPLIRYVPVQCAGRQVDTPYCIAGMPVGRGLTVEVDDGDPGPVAQLEERALAACAERIAGMLASGAETLGKEPLEPRHLAVLLTSNAQVAAMRSQLLRRGVPCAGAGRSSVLDGDCALELELLLHALLHLGDEAVLRAALSTRLLGFDLPALRALEADRGALEAQARRLEGWLQRWHGAGVLAVVESVLDHRTAALLAQSGGERLLTDLRHLGELLQALGAQCHGPVELLARFRRLRRESAARGEDTQLRLESDAGRVQLKTLHGSKGLEFPIVFLPLSWRPRQQRQQALIARFHDPADGQLAFDLGSAAFDEHLALARQAQQSEALRLLYVGLTRAQHAVFVQYAHQYPHRDPAKIQPGPLALLLADLGAGNAADGLARLRQLQLTAPIRVQDGYPRGFTRWHGPAAAQAPAQAQAQARAPAARAARTAAPAVAALVLPPSPRRDLPEIRPLYALHSFSGLTSRSRGLDTGTQPAQDEAVLETEILEGALAAVADTDVATRLEALPPAPHPALLELAGLRGPQLGNAAHDVLELAEPGLRIWPEQAALVQRQLRAQGLAGSEDLRESRTRALGVMLERVRSADLGGGRRLAGLGVDEQVREFEFHLPLGGISIHRLRRIATAHGWPQLLPADLSGGELRGLLTGYVDLIACWHGRYYVLDYKSNWLGAQLSDYAPDALQTAVGAARYDLQALLYSVALQRYLRQQLPDYRAGLHLGGSLLLFLRGVGLAPGCGICEWQFPPALLDAIDAALDAAPDVAPTASGMPA